MPVVAVTGRKVKVSKETTTKQKKKVVFI